jgi:hypothetical protein
VFEGGVDVDSGSDGDRVFFVVGVGLHVGLIVPHDVDDEVLYAGDESEVVGVPLLEGSVEEDQVGMVLLDAKVGLFVSVVVVVAGEWGTDAKVDVVLGGMAFDLGESGGAKVFV